MKIKLILKKTKYGRKARTDSNRDDFETNKITETRPRMSLLAQEVMSQK